MFGASKTNSASTGGPADPYFYDVTMLLTGNGTNGAQNNTFLDSSSNAFSITRNGNTTQGSFSPYGSLWSNYFNGSSRLSLASNSAFAFGTGDFTIEFWMFQSNTSSYGIFTTDQLNVANSLQIYTESNGGLTAQFSGSPEYQAQTGALSKNAWHHCALVRTSGTSQWYIDGVATGSSASTPSNITATSSVLVGSFLFSGSYYDFTGYLSNLRVVKGTAVYSGSFTPSTTPLTAISGTSLLTCQSNRFIDNSSNAFALTVNGTPSVQRFSPFNTTASYDTATIGGSGYFSRDGASSLYTASNSAWDLGSDNFTIEAWVYPTLDTSSVIITRAANGSTYPTFELTMYAGTWRFYSSSSGSSYNINLNSNIAPKLNEWQHVAVTRSGSTYTIWINGVSANTATSSDSLVANSNTVGIGAYPDNANRLKGYISNLRLVKGTAVYTTTFTPPTAPLTAVSGTQLLMSFTNAGIPDSAMMNDLETVGNAQVSTSVKKFGTGSIYLDGTGDNLKTPYSSLFNFGTGDFTVECWANISYVQYSAILSSMSNGITSAMWLLGFSNTAHQMTFGMDSGGNAICGADYTAYENTWTHIAACRSGSTLKLFFNGTQVQSVTNTTNFTGDTSNPVSVGTRYTNEANYYMNGYIDDLRITKGYARYTANFTPPTSALPTY